MKKGGSCYRQGKTEKFLCIPRVLPPIAPMYSQILNKDSNPRLFEEVGDLNLAIFTNQNITPLFAKIKTNYKNPTNGSHPPATAKNDH